MTFIVRIFLTFFVIMKSYGETGPWTAAALALMAVSIEILAFSYGYFADEFRHERAMRKWERDNIE